MYYDYISDSVLLLAFLSLGAASRDLDLDSEVNTKRHKMQVILVGDAEKQLEVT